MIQNSSLQIIKSCHIMSVSPMVKSPFSQGNSSFCLGKHLLQTWEDLTWFEVNHWDILMKSCLASDVICSNLGLLVCLEMGYVHFISPICFDHFKGNLVGGWATPLKNMVRQLGWWNSQYSWENKIHGHQTTNQEHDGNPMGSPRVLASTPPGSAPRTYSSAPKLPSGGLPNVLQTWFRWFSLSLTVKLDG